MRARRSLTPWLVVLSLCIPALDAAEAATFKVIPIKLYFENNQKTQTLTIRNEHDEPVTLQFETMEWSQDAQGQDAYVPTKDLVLFPKIVTVAAHSDKLIRLGYQGPTVTNQERAYRVYLTELPVSKPGQATLQMAMRLGLPVFISPAQGHPTLEIIAIAVTQDMARLLVKNPSNQHAYVKTIRVAGQAASGAELFTGEGAGWYLLPGNQRTFPIKLPAHDCARVSTVHVTLTFSHKDLNQPPVTSTTAVTPSHCARSTP